MTINNVEKLEKGQVRVTANVPAEDFNAAVDEVYRQTKNQISIPGFRKGKVTRKMAEAYFGKGIFQDEAIDGLLKDIYPQVISEAKLLPEIPGSLEKADVDDETGLTLHFLVTEMPVATIEGYLDLDVHKDDAVVTEEMVNREMQSYVDQASRLVSTEKPSENGDTVTVNFVGTLDGVAFEGGTAENVPIVLGSGSMIPGFEEQLVGHSAGEEFDFQVTFPADYRAADLAGKEASFHITVLDVQVKESPEIDDEFAKDVSQYDTLEEFRKHLEEELAQNAKETAEDKYISDVFGGLIAKVKDQVEIPEAIVNHRVDGELKSMTEQAETYHMSLDDLLRAYGTNRARMIRDLRKRVTDQAYLSVVWAAIAQAEGYSVEDLPLDQQEDPVTAHDALMDKARLMVCRHYGIGPSAAADEGADAGQNEDQEPAEGEADAAEGQEPAEDAAAEAEAQEEAPAEDAGSGESAE